MKDTSTVARFAVREPAGVEMTGVHALRYHDARIPAETLVELPLADVDRVDAERAPREQAVGESARGRADVEAHAAGHLHPEGVERAGQLLAATSDERGRGHLLDLDVGRDQPPCLRGHSAGQADTPREDQPRGLGTARGESPRHEKLVQAEPRPARGSGGPHTSGARRRAGCRASRRRGAST
jgi:hypothetical protein